METNKVNRLLLWATIILFATNLSMAITFLYHRTGESKENNLTAAGTTGGADELRARTFRDQLNLQADQMDAFRNYTQSYNQNANGLSRKLEELRIEMVTELGKENPDTAILNKITTSIGNEHARLKNLTIEYYQDLKKICNPEQRGKLNNIFMSVVNKGEDGKFPQQGGGYRHRYGRRQN